MVDGLLYLREGYTCYSVVNIAVMMRQVERRDDGGLQIVVLRQTLFALAPCFEESIGLEVGGSFCWSSSLLKRHCRFDSQEVE